MVEILEELEKDRLFYEQSGGGVTFSGGEPLAQWEFLLEALTACGERRLHRAVDTSGAAPEEVLLRVAEVTDLFLFDIKTMDPKLHRAATGASLDPILANLRRLVSAGGRVRVRIPLIPGIIDAAGMDRAGKLLASLPGIEGVDLLPFHRSALDKHRRFSVPWRLPPAEQVSEEQMRELASRLTECGLPVHVAGRSA